MTALGGHSIHDTRDRQRARNGDASLRVGVATTTGFDVGITTIRIDGRAPFAAVSPRLRDALVRPAREATAVAIAVPGVAAWLVATLLGISVPVVAGEGEENGPAPVAENELRRRADESPELAVADATKADRLLYVLNLRKLHACLERPQRELAYGLFRKTMASYRDAYGDAAGEPSSSP